ncbi:unnamed protein product [Pseudo-nitzschia multistriata]|uniref:Uncharacterized protein n=1 Tax=Pseudo-nitzschia multistriata TaxID=183589 RepID=A0A448Z358_9STRA|nr:unnamed protein product [Pseudo-nitzschia multistriata]
MEVDSPPRNQSPRILKLVENLADIRERPKTMLTPETKRTRTMEDPPIRGPLTPEGESTAKVPVLSSGVKVEYPTNISMPSRSVIEALYNISLQEEEEEEEDQKLRNEIHEKSEYYDQKYLKPAGILSFEEILLPAVGLAEEKALKQAQSRVQRDAPEYTFAMENCRRLVRKSIRNAILEVQSSRMTRTRCQQERRLEQALERKRVRERRHRERLEEDERRAKERALKKEISRAEKRRQLAREYPRNQDLWKEIVFLTSSVAQLEREERMWVQIEKNMVQLKDKNGKEEELKNRSNHPLDSNLSSSSSDVIVVKADKSPLHLKTEEKVKDIVLASTRIQNGLGMILKLLDASEFVQKSLFDEYRKDHAFHGYQGMDNPKGIIRFLSQSQDDLPDNPKGIIRLLSQSQ